MRWGVPQLMAKGCTSLQSLKHLYMYRSVVIKSPTCSLAAAVPEMLPCPSQTYTKPFHPVSTCTSIQRSLLSDLGMHLTASNIHSWLQSKAQYQSAPVVQVLQS